MKYLLAFMLCILVAGVARYDRQANKVEKVFRCNFAVEKLGNAEARHNFARNELRLFGGKMPDISPQELLLLGQRAREELRSTGQPARIGMARTIETWNTRECAALHQQPPINAQRMLTLIDD